MSLEDVFLALVEVVGPREAIRHLMASIYEELEDHPAFYRIKHRIERECRVPID